MLGAARSKSAGAIAAALVRCARSSLGGANHGWRSCSTAPCCCLLPGEVQQRDGWAWWRRRRRAEEAATLTLHGEGSTRARGRI